MNASANPGVIAWHGGKEEFKAVAAVVKYFLCQTGQIVHFWVLADSESCADPSRSWQVREQSVVRDAATLAVELYSGI